LNPGHNGGFDVDEDTLAIGVGLYAGYALSRLG
jgi:metal-dependent amidase/aminoacylase/carboxypeptidase family protein